jgi:hypothetical protein
MAILALTDQQETLWRVAIALGFVVVLAVAALLTILVLLVRTIERRVDQVKATLVRTAENTSNTTLITTTGGGVDLILAEGLEHHLFLGRVLDKVRS